MAGYTVECKSISDGKETHLPSLVNTGGCEVVLESVSADQRHRRVSVDVVVVVGGGPCAAWWAAALNALAFDLRAGIWPNLARLRKTPSATHSASPDPDPEMFFFLFFFFFFQEHIDDLLHMQGPKGPRSLPTEKGIPFVSLNHLYTTIDQAR